MSVHKWVYEVNSLAPVDTGASSRQIVIIQIKEIQYASHYTDHSCRRISINPD